MKIESKITKKSLIAELSFSVFNIRIVPSNKAIKILAIVSGTILSYFSGKAYFNVVIKNENLSSIFLYDFTSSSRIFLLISDSSRARFPSGLPP